MENKCENCEKIEEELKEKILNYLREKALSKRNSRVKREHYMFTKDLEDFLNKK